MGRPRRFPRCAYERLLTSIHESVVVFLLIFFFFLSVLLLTSRLSPEPLRGVYVDSGMPRRKFYDGRVTRLVCLLKTSFPTSKVSASVERCRRQEGREGASTSSSSHILACQVLVVVYYGRLHGRRMECWEQAGALYYLLVYSVP